jgi:septal ring factor EnvC (AmiA/AmiB activator)
MAVWVLFSITVLLLSNLAAQENEAANDGLAAQYEKIQKNLEQSLQELADVQETIAAEKLPLSREISRWEESLSDARSTYEKLSGRLDSRNMDLNNLRKQIENLEQQKTYVSSPLLFLEFPLDKHCENLHPHKPASSLQNEKYDRS